MNTPHDKKAPAAVLSICAAVMQLAASSPSIAQDNTWASRCTSYGGNEQCLVANATFFPTTGPNERNRYSSGLQACIAAAGSSYGSGLRNAAFYTVHPSGGQGCEYDVYDHMTSTTFIGRLFYAWVGTDQTCPAPGATGGYYDSNDTSVHYAGRRWCTYRTPERDLSCPINNPTTPGLGTKIERSVDYADAGPDPLALTRHYRSRWAAGVASETGGLVPMEQGSLQQAGWLGSHQRSIRVDTRYLRHRALIVRADGSTVEFHADPVASGARMWVTYQRNLDTLTGQRNGPAGALSGWVYRSVSDGSQETFDANGKLLSIKARNGWTTTLTYNAAGQLESVRNHFGRELRFTYDVQGRLKEALPPGSVSGAPAGATNSPIRYAYDGPESLGAGVAAQGQLTSVTWQNGKVRRYHYEDSRFPGALTGITDEVPVRYGTYTYDARGRVQRSEHVGGIDRVDFGYSDYTSGASSITTTATTYSGPSNTATETTFTFAEVRNARVPVGQDQPAGSGCAASSSAQEYDTNGNVVRRDDFNRHRACFGYDVSRNLQTVQVEGLANTALCSEALAASTLPAGSRKTSTQWHPELAVETRVAEPLKRTSYVYNGQSDPFQAGAAAACAPPGVVLLCKRVEQATLDADGSQGFNAALDPNGTTRTWNYTYDADGLVLTETDPLNNVTSYAYYSDTTVDRRFGDLKSVKPPLVPATQYTKYNAAGQVLQSLDANGVATDYAYDARQRLLSTITAGAKTSYEWHPTGLLKKVIAPDASFVAYGYDDAHRLTSISDHLGNSITYTLDAAGNRTAEAVKDPSNTLRRQAARSFDLLSRLQRLSPGASQ